MINATVDIGTNSVLLLIASPLPLNIIRDEARITRLGEGLHQNKNFLPQAKERTLQALTEYDQICRAHGVAKVLCVGTAAFRKAGNGKQFAEAIGRQFGWETRIISGKEEARLSFLSVKHDFGKKFSNLMALDIGGGSTEIISKQVERSLPFGTVLLTEKYLLSDPPQKEELLNLRAAIDKNLLSLNPKRYTLNPVIIALAGTATTLSSINQKMTKWDPKKIQGSVMTLPELEKMIALLRSTNHEERSTIPGMVPGREDTLLAGALILQAILKKLGMNRVIVSDRGLRYGLFYEEFS